MQGRSSPVQPLSLHNVPAVYADWRTISRACRSPAKALLTSIICAPPLMAAICCLYTCESSIVSSLQEAKCPVSRYMSLGRTQRQTL